LKIKDSIKKIIVNVTVEHWCLYWFCCRKFNRKHLLLVRWL